MKKRILLTSILTIALCFSLMVGATFALFTSESNVNVAISSGKVDVTAEAVNFKVYSGQWNETNLSYDSVEQQDMTFATKGTVNVDGNNIVITNMVPMDKVTFDIVIKNNSNIAVQYQTIINSVSESAVNLLNALEIKIIDTATSVVPTTKVGNSVISDWALITPSLGGDNTVTTLNVSILLPEGTGNEYQGLAANLTYTVKAIQGNAHTVNPEVDEDVVQIYSVEDLKALAASVNSGTTYLRKTVKLMANLDLNNEEWTPIGNSSNPFKGTFDGNGLTISNLYINKEGTSNIGLFGMTTDGEIKNLTLRNANVKGYLNVGALSGTPYTSKYTNIKILGDVKVEGFSYVGAVGGKNAYANWDNITVEVNEGSYVKASSISGATAYRTYVGGVIGFMGEGGHTVSNVTSNIDVFGDVCDVGGVVGIAHYGNNFKNIVCSGNVTLYNPVGNEDSPVDGLEIGGIAGVWHNGESNVTLTDCKFTGKLVSKYDLNGQTEEITNFSNNGLVGKAYSVSGNGSLIIDGQAYIVKTASTLAEVKQLLSAATTNMQGVEIDCGGANLGEATYTTFSANSVIKNATFEATRWSTTKGDVTFIGCTFTNSLYAFHIDSGKGELTFIDCTFEGWCPVAGTVEKVTLENCTIKGSGTYGVFRFYQNAELINCTIDCSNTNHTDTYPDGISAVNGAVVELKGCTLVYCNYDVRENSKIIVDGVVVAEDN